MSLPEIQQDVIEMARVKGKMTSLKLSREPIPMELRDVHMLISRALHSYKVEDFR